MSRESPALNRWSVRLVDSQQERRFILNHLPLQRRATLAAAIIVLLATLVEGAFLAVSPGVTLSRGRIVALIVAVVLGMVATVLLWKDRRPRLIRSALIVSGLGIAVMVAILILAGIPATTQGALLAVGGVIIFYFSARLDVIMTVETAVGYSIITVPAWLASGHAGSDRDIAFTAAALVIAHVAGYVEIRRNFWERRLAFAQREEFERISSLDALTGLLNRRAFDRWAADSWAAHVHHRSPLSAIMCDIDHFKELNDSRGHAAGDVALRVVAQVISAAMPAGDDVVAARYGGEEFVCLLPNHRRGAAVAVAEAIRQQVVRSAIDTASPTGDRAYRSVLTVSLGVATATSAMTTVQDLVDAADRQLYAAKADGRNAVRVAAA